MATFFTLVVVPLIYSLLRHNAVLAPAQSDS
jgi:hypothetical protein